jgi:3-hydroxybutyryl-CoA dehydrogenase
MIQQIGIVGAGQMGRGIAQVAAASGAHVLLADQTIPLATAGCDAIKASLAHLVE